MLFQILPLVLKALPVASDQHSSLRVRLRSTRAIVMPVCAAAVPTRACVSARPDPTTHSSITMGVVPATRIGKIEFYESHLSAWAANAEAIGLTSAQVLALQTLVMTARGSWLDAETAREASKASTLNFHTNTDNMATIGSALLSNIRAFAETSGDANVYALAQIPAPSTPAPVGPPGQPYELGIGLSQTGAVSLTWKCDNPSGASGTVYEIQRRIGSESFQFLEIAGERSFEDGGIPAGSTGIVYQITAVRGKTRGPAAQFLVNFGTGSSGVSVSDVTDGDIRIAA